MRKLLAAFLLALSFTPALAQLPPPVPALPDTERRTAFALSSSTCACSVGFALYGDGTDVDQWIEVWVGGVRYLSTDAAHGWSLTSATGPLATIARPITNAVLTFTAAQTGTVQVVGAQRPRRLSQFAENRGVAARDLNQVITGLTAMEREFWDFKARAFVAAVGSAGSIVSGLSSGMFGPASSTDGQIALFGGTSGAAIVGGPVLSDGQLVVGQTSARPLGKTLFGDVTLNASGQTTIGANRVTPGMIQTQLGTTLLGVPGAASGTPTAFSLFSLPFSAVVNPTQDILMIRSNSDGAFHYTTPQILVTAAGGGSGSVCTSPFSTDFFCGSAPGSIQSDAIDDTGVGFNAGAALIHSSANTAFGSKALQFHTSDLTTHGLGQAGGHNVAIGTRAMNVDANSDENVAVGADAMPIHVGHSPGWNPAGLVMNGTCVNGSTTVTVASTTGITAGQVFQAPCFPNDNRGLNLVISVTDATHWVASEPANASTTVSFDFNADLTGGKNVAVGRQAMQGSIYSHYNVCVGLTPCQWITVGRENTGVGATALDGCTWCSLNTAIGANAMGGYYNPPTNGSPFGTPVTSIGNVALGYNTMIFATTAAANVGIGVDTLASCSTCSNNVAIGNGTLFGNWNPVSVTGTEITISNVVAIGADIAGLTSASYTTLIGAKIATCGGALSNATVLGARVDCSTVANSEVHIADGAGNVRLKANSAGNVLFPSYSAAGIVYLGASGLLSAVAGTSGGIPYFAGSNLPVSSGLLTQYGPVYGGGAGGAPVAMAAGTDGQIVVGQTAGAPLWKSMNTDATLSAAGALTIANGAVTLAKMANVSATQRLHGRNTAGAGIVEEVTAAQALDWIGSTRGQILYRGASGWAALATGTLGQVLSTNGAGADPSWIAASGTGTVTSVICSGLTITTTGTCPEPFSFKNCSLAASVSANILTVALKDAAGSDPTASSPCRISYRSATATTGSHTSNSQTAALSITTNATGASLGSANNTAFRFWVVSFDNAGTNVLALFNAHNTTQCFPINEGVVQTSIAISGSAISAGVFYSPNGTTVTSKAIKIIGYVEYNATGLATAGTYASAPNFIQTFGTGIKKPCETVQKVIASTTTRGTASTATAYTNTGVNWTGSITPTSAANGVQVNVTGGLIAGQGGANGGNAVNLRVIRGTTGDVQVGTNFSLVQSVAAGNTNDVFSTAATIVGLDFPNIASSQTYSPQIKTNNVATDVLFPYGDTASPTGGAVGYMLMEEIMGALEPANDNGAALSMVG